MSSPSSPVPRNLFEEPTAVAVMFTGVLVLNAGTGLQVLWLILVVLGAVLGAVTTHGPTPP